ncbi:MAG: hypothetical protein WDN25_04060 [Acetobacteraceae bacterium]
MDLLSLLAGMPALAPYLPILLAIAGLCAAAAAVLPPPKRQGAYFLAYTAINWIGMNLGHARNASAPPVPPTLPKGNGLAVALIAASLLALTACAARAHGGPPTAHPVLQPSRDAWRLDGPQRPPAMVVARWR